MKNYACLCGNRLFFENTRCIQCDREVGWCEVCSRITTLQPAPAEPPDARAAAFTCGYSDCGQPLQKCRNYAIENVCNRCYLIAPDSRDQPAEVSDSDYRLCQACELTGTIPDLSLDGNREKWARLESAKRRLLYILDRLALPYRDADPPLSFDFLADVERPGDEWRNVGPAEIVYTGHANGKITINIREADDAIREHLRVQFHEAHRTLVGHFRHEVGHYYWDLLIKNRCEKQCGRVFGDHESPPYQDAMENYYQNGPRPDWQTTFISAYASAHPWEDFAETFALYLDIASVLDTAAELFKSINANFRSRSITPLIQRFQEVGILVNEFNRTMGLLDLAPKIITTPVAEKLEFVHSLVKRAPRLKPKKGRPGRSPVDAIPESAQHSGP